MRREYLHEQGTGRINEDSIALNGNMFGVFDGATSLSGQVFENGKTGGLLASETAKDIFSKNNDSLENLASKANSAIFDKMIEHNVNISEKISLWSTSAAVVKIVNDAVEWLQIGDSLILLIYKDGSYKIPVKDYDHDSETLSMWKTIAQRTDKKIFQVMNTQIKKVREAMNVDYGVLNGEKAFSGFIKSGREDIKDLSHVLLFTDGLFIPSEDPLNKKFEEFVSLFKKGGLAKIRDHVRNMEESDPECRLYPRFKLHDDIAAISIEIPAG